MEIFSLKGRTAIVAGACGLLGRHHCQALAEAGAQVVAADLDEQAAITITAELGTAHLGLGLNVTDPASIQEARARILDRYKRIDILVNNAAINDKFEDPVLGSRQSMFEHYPLEMWDRSWQVNVSGVILCSL